jgi:hypothetical protein
MQMCKKSRHATFYLYVFRCFLLTLVKNVIKICSLL